jgi:hypothetical protein
MLLRQYQTQMMQGKDKKANNIDVFFPNADVFASEYITHEAESDATIQAIIELGPETAAAIPQTMNIPEPILPCLDPS